MTVFVRLFLNVCLLQHGTAKDQGLNASKVCHFSCWWYSWLQCQHL